MGKAKRAKTTLAQRYLDVEGEIHDLCRAVKVISSVIADQLADPIDGPPVTSDYGPRCWVNDLHPSSSSEGPPAGFFILRGSASWK